MKFTAKKWLPKIVVLVGLMGLFLLMIIFGPVIFGSASGANDVSKYAGSPGGDNTIAAVHGTDAIFQMFFAPSGSIIVLIAISAMVFVLFVAYKHALGKNKGKRS